MRLAPKARRLETGVRIASALSSCAAHMSAVWPLQRSCSFTRAPAAMSAASVATSPVRAAVMRAVSPSGSAELAFAPSSSSSFTSAAWPFSAASVSGGTP